MLCVSLGRKQWSVPPVIARAVTAYDVMTFESR